jgi:DNA polymerase (family X)
MPHGLYSMTTPNNNQKIAELFRSIADLLAAQRANPYRVRAYRRAADSLLALEEDVADAAKRNALEEIDGIGKDLSEKIEEFLRTGKIQNLETLRSPLPDPVKAWAQLPGLSESLVAYLYSRLSIATLADLELLVRSHLLRTVPGFSGSEEDLLQAITNLRRQEPVKRDATP